MAKARSGQVDAHARKGLPLRLVDGEAEGESDGKLATRKGKGHVLSRRREVDARQSDGLADVLVGARDDLCVEKPWSHPLDDQPRTVCETTFRIQIPKENDRSAHLRVTGYK